MFALRLLLCCGTNIGYVNMYFVCVCTLWASTVGKWQHKNLFSPLNSIHCLFREDLTGAREGEDGKTIARLGVNHYTSPSLSLLYCLFGLAHSLFLSISLSLHTFTRRNRGVSIKKVIARSPCFRTYTRVYTEIVYTLLHRQMNFIHERLNAMIVDYFLLNF